MTTYALLSVHDKTGLYDFARGLHDLDWTLLASGGTARALRAADLPVTTVEEFTGSPEVLGGRVKTLHPAIHGGILARDTDADRADLLRLGSAPIDLVCVNLYPFEQTVARAEVTLEEAVEQIDIGGVALLRASAKNFARVTVLCDPSDYAVLDELRAGPLSAATRRRLAVKAFALTARYDAAINRFLEGKTAMDSEVIRDSLALPRNDTPATEQSESPNRLVLDLPLFQTLRYGENPHQHAALYTESGAGPLGGTLLQGKELSYNNLLDLDAAWRAVVSFEEAAVVIVKHLSPCGIATGAALSEAFKAALESDSVSAYGGVIAANRQVDAATVAAFGDLFVECIAAPGYSPEALERLARRKNCRLVNMADLTLSPAYELRSVNRGILRQKMDRGDPEETTWRVVTQRAPTEAELPALRFAWRACQHVRSNAIVLAQGTATVGIGSGQPNRVDSVRIAVQRAGARSQGAVLASDAFFPFPDGVEQALAAGVTAFIQPGGSVRDREAIAAADRAGAAMLFTGVRHFRH